MSASGKMDVDPPSEHKPRDRSTDTRKSHRSTRRSRSRERDHDRRERRPRDDDDRERRRRSRSRDRHAKSSHRDKDREREKGDRERDKDKDSKADKDKDSRADKDKERDKERDRDRDRERGDRRRDRDRGHDRRDRDKERDHDRDDRRRKREDENGADGRAKRKRADEDAPPPAAGGRDERPRDRDEPPRRRGGRSPAPFLPPIKRQSPNYAAQQAAPAETEDYNPDAEPKEDDSEARSVFVSQLAARLTARDLGYFFEDKLGEGSVMDARIVTDRISRRSKGIGYVEMRTIELVDQAINLSSTVVMGLPIKVQHTEAERNRTHAGEGNIMLPPGVTMGHGPLLYVGSLHFNLTESDIKQVFEPFGELEFVDLHRDPGTGRSKGYCFIQYKRQDDAKMALEQMEGFELAGRQLRVNTVHEKGTGVRYSNVAESLDDAGGGNLNAASRQALMQKLARTETEEEVRAPSRPVIASTLQSKCVLLTNMFTPEDETERDWDKDLSEEVKGECQEKYGQVEHIKLERDSQGEIYVQFDSVDAAKKSIAGLNGRWFGGKQISATFIPDAIMQAHK